jgi:hypothetical protein
MSTDRLRREKFTQKELAMVQLAPYNYSIIIEFMLSDG